jgi:hypothetical protein
VTFLERETLSKMVPNARTRSFFVLTVQVNEGFRRMYDANDVKAAWSVIWRIAVVSRSGTAMSAVEQMGGSWMLAMTWPWNCTSRPAGSSMSASKGPLRGRGGQR